MEFLPTAGTLCPAKPSQQPLYLDCFPADQREPRGVIYQAQDLVSSDLACLVIGLPRNLSFMEVLYGVGVFWEGPAMDTRRSFFLSSREDDFAEPPVDASRLDFSDIPYVMPANDNLSTKERLSAHCGHLLRRFVGLHSLRWSDTP